MHNAPPPDLDLVALSDAVRDGWGVDKFELRYLPVGGGAYHWHLTGGSDSLFVTVDDLDDKDWLGEDRDTVAETLYAALGVARWLHDDAGLAFVLAPLVTTHGPSLMRFADRYTVSVSPYLDGRCQPFGPHTDRARRWQVIDALAALHSVTPPPGTPNLVEPIIGVRHDLEAFLDDPGECWTAGPLGEQARALLVPHAVELAARLHAFDRSCRALATESVVVTHGEPHAANVMTVGDRDLLIDWDTVGLAIPERDLMFVILDDADAERYADATGHVPNPAALALYRTRWDFDDLSHIIQTFRGAHDDGPESDRWLAVLQPLIDAVLAASIHSS